MIIDFIFLLILSVLLYSYTRSQTQFSATASVIHQIWSGSCRLCRHSEHSGLSGLSGLPPRGNSILTQAFARSTVTGPTRDCNCDTCPCTLMDNFLRNCRPVTDLYAQFWETIWNLLTSGVDLVTGLYEYSMEFFREEDRSQEIPQITSYKPADLYRKAKEELNLKKNASAISEKINKIEKDAIENIKSIPDKIKLEKKALEDEAASALPQVGTSKEAKSFLETGLKESSSFKDKVKDLIKNAKKDASPPAVESPDDSLGKLKTGYCSKCIEKGRTCIDQCPRAKLHKKPGWTR